MELVANKTGSISINGTDASIVVDPSDKGETGEVVLFVDIKSPRVEDDFGDSIVVAGPGEYEVGGFLMHCEATENGVYCTIEHSNERALIVNASDLESVSSDTRFGTIVVRLDDKFDEGTSASLPGELVVLYGDGEHVTSGIEKMDKIGRRKKRELVGKTIYLSK